MEKDKKLKQFRQRELPYESNNDNLNQKKDADYFFGEIGIYIYIFFFFVK